MNVFLTTPPPDEGDAVARTAGQVLDETTSRFADAWRATLEWVQANAVEAGLAAAGALAAFIALVLVRRFAVAALNRIEWRDNSSYAAIAARAVGRINTAFLLFVAIAAATRFIEPPQAVADVIRLLFIVVTVIQVASLTREVLTSIIRRQAMRGGADAGTLRSAITILRWLIGVAVWSIALLVILDNLNVDITGLIAGLGDLPHRGGPTGLLVPAFAT